MERTPERTERVRNVVKNRQEAILVLEDIHDPHNAQAVIRSCDCFGVQKIYVIFDKEKQFNPERMGKLASSSANKWLSYEIFTSTQECFKKLKAEGYHIIGTALREDAGSIYDFDFTEHKKLALCFGNEHAGLSDYAVDNVDHRMIIPMHGMIQSLNLSFTSAITLFEMTRQRRAKGFEDFSLENSESDALFQAMIEK